MKPDTLALLAAAMVCANAWSAATPPPSQVRATCSCMGKTPAWPVLTQQPNAYAPRSVAVVAPWFQLPCVQPARGPL